MKFGDYLREKREARDWTQPEAAAKAAIEQSYLSKLETGKSYPSEDVFVRLVEAYSIDITQLTDAVSSHELAKLREVSQIRAFLIDRDTKARRASRGWLLAGLAMLMLSGGSFGLTSLSEVSQTESHTYKSMGVLKPGEPLETFEVISVGYPSEGYEEEQRHQSEITERIDERIEKTTEFRGDFFVEDSSDGRRYFDRSRTEIIETPSPLRWFFIPALTFLFGAIGGFFISFRWR